MNTLIPRATVLALITLASSVGHAATIDLEGVTMPNEQSYAGPGGGTYWSGLVPPTDGSIQSQFGSHGAHFTNINNECCGGATFWNGFAYSRTGDTTTAGFSNEFSAYAGSGSGDSATYGLAYVGGEAAPRVAFDTPTVLASAMFTNTTYAALSMRDGDSFAKRFGGADGTDPDFLRLTIVGRDSANAVTGAVDFYLADFRAADNTQDYIVQQWTQVPLASLGAVSALEFSLTSSDVGPFGANTPLYFAVDNLAAVPIPAPVFLLAPALCVMLSRRRRGVQAP
jgi:hypothetical protein